MFFSKNRDISNYTVEKEPLFLKYLLLRNKLFMMLRALIIILLISIGVNCNPESVTILVVVDGLNYLHLDESYGTGNLRHIVKTGASVRDVMPVFPSEYYPNLASLVTGMYPEFHQIIDNDEVYFNEGKLFRNQSDFWNATRELETIWVRYL